LSSSPQVIRHFLDTLGSKVYGISSMFHPVSLFTRLKADRMLPYAVPPLGSVGVAAVYLALKMTQNDVMLTGLDFSYPFMKNHSSDSPHARMALSRVKRTRAAGQTEYAQFLARPRISSRDKKGRPLVSDLILQGYAENVRALSESSGRIVEISEAGLDLGGRKFYKTSAKPGTINPATDTRVTGASATPGKTTGSCFDRVSQRDVLSFLKKEKLLLEQAEKIMAERIKKASEDEEKLSDEDMQVLVLIDYVWFHLPHRLILPDCNKSSLAAILLHCGYFKKRIERSMACLVR